MLVSKKLEVHFYLILILLCLSRVFFLLPPVQVYENCFEKEISSEVNFYNFLSQDNPLCGVATTPQISVVSDSGKMTSCPQEVWKSCLASGDSGIQTPFIPWSLALTCGVQAACPGRARTHSPEPPWSGSDPHYFCSQAIGLNLSRGPDPTTRESGKCKRCGEYLASIVHNGYKCFWQWVITHML